MSQKYDKVFRTQHEILGFVQIDKTTWMFVSLEEPKNPSQVGPQYGSKAELLADLPRYAWEIWKLGGPPALPAPDLEALRTEVIEAMKAYDGIPARVSLDDLFRLAFSLGGGMHDDGRLRLALCRYYAAGGRE